jgi:hypothetical protein
VIKIQGELRAAQTGELISDCTSTLLDPSGGTWESATPIEPQFRRMFTVAPSDTVYTLAIACPNYEARNIAVARSSSTERVHEQNLGTIEFERLAE